MIEGGGRKTLLTKPDLTENSHSSNTQMTPTAPVISRELDWLRTSLEAVFSWDKVLSCYKKCEESAVATSLIGPNVN